LVNEIVPSGEVLHLRNVLPLKPQTNGGTDESKTTPASNERPQVDGGLKTGNNDPQKETQSETKETAEAPAFTLSDDDRALLDSYFGADVAQKIITLHDRARASPKARPYEFGRIQSSVVTDRDLRTKMHQAIRRIFASQLETTTDNDGALVISVAPNRHKRSGFRGESRKPGRARFDWEELGGPYLHFTVYKENKDTMEVISFLSRQLKMNAKSFQFAGTKDRRAVTVQRASVLRMPAERLAGFNKSLRNAALGDFEYHKQGLELGALAGNEFVITLRECEFPSSEQGDLETAVKQANEIVGKSLRDLRDRGYLNYFGLQRFGTFSTRTDAIGIKMLQGDFKGAVEAILHFSPEALAAAQAPAESEQAGLLIGSDDKARAEGIHIFQTGGKVNAALDKIPRKFSAETSLIRHLSRSKNDYLGALQTIHRNLRMIYVHAYQSLVWNFAASERWRLYGDRVVEGDLVIINEHKDSAAKEEHDGIDADGEIIVMPHADDTANAADDLFVRARALSAEEAASGKYSVFDIVLPLPGFDVIYPPNEMTEFYKRFMGSERGGHLDPSDMRRKWKDISLSGGYRKLLSRPGSDYSFEVHRYSQDDQQFVQTDLERLTSNQPADAPGSASGDGDKIALVIKFQLGVSQYATMALRELMKSGGVKEYKPDFGGGR
jgi:tRNA pseudouridine13 synthase